MACVCRFPDSHDGKVRLGKQIGWDGSFYEIGCVESTGQARPGLSMKQFVCFSRPLSVFHTRYPFDQADVVECMLWRNSVWLESNLRWWVLGREIPEKIKSLFVYFMDGSSLTTLNYVCSISDELSDNYARIAGTLSSEIKVGISYNNSAFPLLSTTV